MAVPVPEQRRRWTSLVSKASNEGRRGRFERARLAVEIIAAYVRTRRALRSAPVATVLAGLRSRAAHPNATTVPVEDRLSEARRLGSAVTRALRMLPGDTRCLMQALVLTRVLERRGISAKLVIGARTVPSFFAHAWVEYLGQPVLSDGGGLFDKLVEL